MEAIRVLLLINNSVDLGVIQWAVTTAQLNIQLLPVDFKASLFTLLSQNEFDCIITDPDSKCGAQAVLVELTKLHKTKPLIVFAEKDHGPSHFINPMQGRVSVVLGKDQLTPQLLGQCIYSTTQIHAEIQRGELLQQDLSHERRRFEMLLHTMPVAILDMDKKGVVTQCQGTVLGLFGIDTGALLGQSAWDVFPKCFQLEDAIYNTLSGESYRAEFEGEAGTLYSHYFPVYDACKNIDGIVGFFLTKNDANYQTQIGALREVITDLENQNKQLKEQLHDSVTQLGVSRNAATIQHECLSKANLALFQILVTEDKQLSIHYMSPAIMQMTGFDAQQLSHRGVLQQLLDAQQFKVLTQLIHCASYQWLPVSTNIKIRSKDGHIRCLHVYAKPSAHNHGMLWHGYLQQLDDAAVGPQGEQAESDLQQTLCEERDAALEQVKLKSLFLMSMAKEMCVPLETMVSMVNLLLETQLDPEQCEFASMVYDACHALITMTYDIIDVSTCDAQEFKLTEVDFDVRAMIDEIFHRFEALAAFKQIKLYCLQPYNMPQRVYGDAGRLRQILNHLLCNALQNTNSGEITLQVQMVAEQTADIKLRFEICDTGKQISARDRRYLFQMFSPDLSQGMTYRSAGLRLLVARQLTELMGGEFGLYNNAVEGVTFWLALPLKRQLAIAQQGQHKLDAKQLQGARVLIISDQHSSRSQLVEGLQSWQMQVDLANDGDQALELLLLPDADKPPFSAIILDAGIADMDNYTLARVIHQELSLQSLPMLLLTDFAERGDGQKARQAGIMGFLTKPVQTTLLIDCLCAVLGDRSAAQFPALVTRHSIADLQAPQRDAVLLGCHHARMNKSLQAFLSSKGFRVDIAASGPDVLKAQQNQDYKLVLLALDLPVWDGYTTARAIRHRSVEPPPLVGVAHTVTEQQTRICLNAGMRDCIDAHSTEVISQWLHEQQQLTPVADLEPLA